MSSSSRSQKRKERRRRANAQSNAARKAAEENETMLKIKAEEAANWAMKFETEQAVKAATDLHIEWDQFVNGADRANRAVKLAIKQGDEKAQADAEAEYLRCIDGFIRCEAQIRGYSEKQQAQLRTQCFELRKIFWND